MHPLLQPRHNRRSIALVTAPATEPVTVVEAKAFLRIDSSDDDTLLTSMIKVARRMAETYTRRSFITQTVRLTMDGFGDAEETPRDGMMIAPPPHVVDGTRAVQLPRLPAQSISSVTVFGPSNADSVVDPAVYGLDTTGGRLMLNDGQSWPSDLREYAAVEIDFVAGYGDTAADVPEDIRQAILHIVAAMYESRQCADIPAGAKAMLEPYRLPEAYGLW